MISRRGAEAQRNEINKREFSDSRGNILRLLILDSDGGLDRGMGVVALQREVIVAEILQGFHGGIEQHPGKWAWFTRELLAGLIEVVHVEVEVAEGVDELLGLQSADLRDHHRKEGVGGDIEGDTKEEIGTALVELAAEFAVCHVELDEGVAGCQGHLVDLAWIPSADDVSAAVGIVSQILDDARDLVDFRTFGGAPPPPLCAIDGAQVAVCISPLVPDGDAVLLEIADIGISFQEPEKFVNDGAEVELLGSEQREALGEIKALLGTEDREGPRAGAIILPRPVIKHEFQEPQVRSHRNVKASLSGVNAVGIEEWLLLRREIITRFVEFDIEAACKARMAGASMLLHLEEEGVAVAIDEPSQDLLRVAA